MAVCGVWWKEVEGAEVLRIISGDVSKKSGSFKNLFKINNIKKRLIEASLEPFRETDFSGSWA